jgi:hypothetical protein
MTVEQHGQRRGYGNNGINGRQRDGSAGKIYSRFQAGTKDTGGKRALRFFHYQKLAQRSPPVIYFYMGLNGEQ